MSSHEQPPSLPWHQDLRVLGPGSRRQVSGRPLGRSWRRAPPPLHLGRFLSGALHVREQEPGRCGGGRATARRHGLLPAGRLSPGPVAESPIVVVSVPCPLEQGNEVCASLPYGKQTAAVRGLALRHKRLCPWLPESRLGEGPGPGLAAGPWPAEAGGFRPSSLARFPLARGGVCQAVSLGSRPCRWSA